MLSDGAISVPVSESIPDFLAQLDKMGVDSYSFAVEQLEDVLVRIVSL